MPRKQVFLERRGKAKVQLYFIRAVLWEIFLCVNFKDGSFKEQQTAVMASNITGEGKGRENEHFDYIYYTERRRRLKNLLFLLLQNEALSQSYDRIQSHHKRSFRRYLSNSGWFSNVWENYSDERFETIFKSFKRNIHQYTWFYSRWSTTRISFVKLQFH